MSSPVRPPGSVAWVELSTGDADAARAFYASALGWRFGATPAMHGSDDSARVDGSLVAGLRGRRPTGGPPAWTVFVEVEDLDETLARVAAHGGDVRSAPTATSTGRRAEIRDPSGAVLGVLEVGPTDEGIAWGRDGAACWAECLSRDVGASRRFYPAVFGWTAEDTAADYTLFVLDGRHVGGLMAVPATVVAAAPSSWTVYFAVSDLDGACGAVTALGGSVLAPPHDIDEGRFAVVADPTGAVCSFFEGRID